jgi:5-methylcytosine-specific restriction endonuclease McrA
MNHLFTHCKKHIFNMFKNPLKISSTTTKYNKKSKDSKANPIPNDKNISYIPKITFTHLKFKKNNVIQKNNLNNKTNLLKTIIKKIPVRLPKILPTPKEQIPKRIRELVWTTYNGEIFTHKCYVSWCHNPITVFNFQVGHDIPESKGGTLDIDNLKPICINCNLSMSNKYSITEWSKLINTDTLKKIDNYKKNESIEHTIETKIPNELPNELPKEEIKELNINKQTFINTIINKLPSLSIISFLLNK